MGKEDAVWAKVQSLLDHLKRKPGIGFFNRPVDEERDAAPGYYKQVQNPIDLQQIQGRLIHTAYPHLHPNKDRYKAPAEVKQDVLRMFENCMAYNGPLHQLFSVALSMQKEWSEMWQQHDVDSAWEECKQVSRQTQW